LRRRLFIKSTTLAGLGLATGCKKDAPKLVPSGVNQYRKAVIIGSGFGGAVAALRLCQAGIETTILERGISWDTTDPNAETFSDALGSDNRSTWLNRTSAFPFGPPITFPKKYTGVLEKVRMNGIEIMAPAAVGGGSITFGGILATPIREAFESRFPAEISWQQLTDTYFPRVLQQLNASVMPDDVFDHPSFLHNKVFKQHNDNAGISTVDIISNYNWDIVRQEINGSIRPSSIIGEAIFGCNSGAKNSLDKNYLKQANDTGNLEIRPLHNVLDISRNNEGKYVILAEQIDTEGRVIKLWNYLCDYLFLAAGSVGTTKLMVKAKAKGKLPDLNEHTGDGWGNNGMSMLLRGNINTPTGAKQGFPPRYGALYPAGSSQPFFVEHFPFSLGGNIDLRMLGYNMMGLPGVRGSWSYDAAYEDAVLSYPFPWTSDQQQTDQAAVAFCNKLNNINGGDLSPFLGKIPINNVTYHPLGGMVMGKAADLSGRVKNYEKLYVMDGALMPGTTGCCNPALTISGIAERNIETILNEDF
jgi:cholesterol oxidase